MGRRNLPNTALWGFEFIYSQLQEIERQLAAIADDNTLPRHSVSRRVQAARIAALKARERATEVHPKVAQRSLRG